MADMPRSAKGKAARASSSVIADLGKRVTLMEDTCSFGMALTVAIKECLQKSQTSAKDIENWTRIADELLNSTQDKSLLIGVCGETGLGKSSLINALLDMELAPVSESEACTAAVCVFGWNPDDDPRKAFQASVTYKSIENIHQNLTSFIEEGRDLAEAAEENGDVGDRARKEAHKKDLKLIMGWSGLTEDDIMAANTAHDILRKSKHNIIKAKGIYMEETHQEHIFASTERDFRKLLSPFIDSNRRRKPEWALVDVVDIRIKADILRHGIKLVDLPGVMDALESRSAIATSYMWRLDKRIVAVPAARATDSKTAMDLMLPQTDVLEMKLDNQFTRNSVAVAVNCIDDIGVKNAEEEWGELDPIICDLVAEVELQTQAVSDLKAQMDEMEDEIDDLRSSLDASDEEGEDSLASMPQARGHPDVANRDLTDLRALKRNFASLKRNWQAAVHESDQRTHKLRQRCILARNQRIIANFAETFAKSDSASSRSLMTNIFPNSARSYDTFKSGVPVSGFEDIESTGIDALRRWIRKVALPRREEAAKNRLQRLNILFDAANGWIRYSQDGDDELYRLSGHVGKETLDSLILHHNDAAKAILFAMTKSSAQLATLKPLRESHLSLRPRTSNNDNEKLDECDALLTKAIAKWTIIPADSRGKLRNMHWSTFRKCLRQCGGEWTSKQKGGATHSWIDSIYQSFWRPCMDHWIQMHQDLSDVESRLIATVRQHFDAFDTAARNDKVLSPQFRMVLVRDMYLLNHELEAFITLIGKKFKWFRQTIREYRRQTRETFTRRMEVAFSAALQEKGRGSFKRQRDIIYTHIEAIRPDLFKGCRDTLEQNLSRDKNTMITELKITWNSEAKKRMVNKLHEIVRSVCPKLNADYSDMPDFGGTVVTDPEVIGVIQKAITKWSATWADVEPRLPAPKVGLTFEDAEKLRQDQETANDAQNADKKRKRETKSAGPRLIKRYKPLVEPSDGEGDGVENVRRSVEGRLGLF